MLTGIPVHCLIFLIRLRHITGSFSTETPSIFIKASSIEYISSFGAVSANIDMTLAERSP